MEEKARYQMKMNAELYRWLQEEARSEHRPFNAHVEMILEKYREKRIARRRLPSKEESSKDVL